MSTTINIKHLDIIALAAGTRRDVFAFPEEPTLLDLLHAMAHRYGDAVGRILFDHGREVRQGVQFLIGDRLVDTRFDQTRLSDGAAVMVLLPIAGGSTG